MLERSGCRASRMAAERAALPLAAQRSGRNAAVEDPATSRVASGRRGVATPVKPMKEQRGRAGLHREPIQRLRAVA